MVFHPIEWMARILCQLREQALHVRVREPRRRQRASGFRIAPEQFEDRTLLATSSLVSIGDATITEGDSGTANLTFTVTRTGDTSTAISVSYSTADNTATAGSDYTAKSGSVTMAAGVSTATITISINGDTAIENDESFFVNLTGVTELPGTAGNFVPRQDFDTDTEPRSVAVGDINGDGKPDVVIANSIGQISVFLNNSVVGSGATSFAAKQNFDAGQTPYSVAIGDLNGDGKPDVAVANFRSHDVSVLLNMTATGSPTVAFAPKLDMPSAGSAYPYFVSIADVNGDGKPDLTAANQGRGSVSVFLNQTPVGVLSPVFSAHADFDVADNPNTVTFADFNGDGKPDIATANAFDSQITVLFNTTPNGASSPSFGGPQIFNGFDHAISTAAGDVNGDGKIDLIVANREASTVSVLLNGTPTGDTTFSFSDRHDFAVGEKPRSVTLKDLNADGKLDLAVANFGSDSLSVLTNQTAIGAIASSFATAQGIPTGDSPLLVVTADMDGDNKPDLVNVNLDIDTFSVILNSPAVTVPGRSLLGPQHFQMDTSSALTVAADFNGDGKPDIIAGAGPNFDTDVFINTTVPGSSVATFADLQTFHLDENPAQMLAADVNQDGKPDLVTYNTFSSSISVWLNTTASGAMSLTFAPVQKVAVGFNPVEIALGDLSGDGLPELIVGAFMTEIATVLKNTTVPGSMTVSFVSNIDLALPGAADSIAAGDLNGDGRVDLAILYGFDGVVSVFLNNTPTGGGTLSFANREEFTAEGLSNSISIGDVNSDGKLDLAVSNTFANSSAILLNTTTQGSATPSFAAKQVLFEPDGLVTQMSVLTDLTGDGRVDLVAMHSSPDRLTVFNNLTTPGSMTINFPTRQVYHTSGVGFIVVPTDINVDGRTDLVVGNFVSFQLSVLMNSGAALVDNQAVGTILNDELGAPPVVDLNGLDGSGIDFQSTFTEGDAGALIADLDAVLTDQDDLLLANLKLQIGPGPDGAKEIVTVGSLAIPLNITKSGTVTFGGTTFLVSYASIPRTITVTSNAGGTAPIGNFVSLLRTITYTNTSDSPNTTPRTITITATDDALTSAAAIATIVIVPTNDPPTNINLSVSTVPENVAPGSVVGTFTTVDPDTGDSFNYVLISGPGSTDNASFTIVNGELRTAVVLDAEIKSSYSIRVAATDSAGVTVEKQFTITVTNSNEAPTDLSVTPASVAENQPPSTVVGTLSTTDPDAGSTFTYSLVTGAGSTDNNSFTISNGQLRTTAGFNFETKSSYSIRIRTTDQGGLTFEKQLTISVTDVNEGPTDLALSASTITENQPVGTVIGTFLTSDPDSGNTFTYALVTGTGSTDNASFSIVNGQLQTAAVLNFETKSSYSIRVRTTDQGGVSLEKVLVVTATNVNEAPTNITLTPAAILENQPAGTLVGVFGSVDQDIGDTFTYTLVPGAGSTDNASFALANGQLFALSTFDFEAKSSYAIRVRTTDQGGLTFEKQITIAVADTNDAPTGIEVTPSSIAENQPIGTTVGTLTTLDPDTGNTFTYQLVAGAGSTDNVKFTIVNGQLRTASSFDFEAQSTYSIRVRATDQGGLSVEQPLTITIADANEAPTDLVLNGSTVAENQSSGTVVGAFSSSDADVGNAFTYSLVAGVGSTDNAKFTIANGQLLTAASFDFEAKSSYSIRVRSTDQGGLAFEKVFTVSVTDVNEAPTAIALTPGNIAENQPANAVVGVLSTTDPDSGNTFTYALASGLGSTDNGSFVIVNGQLLALSTLNFEIQASYSIRVRSTDQGGLSFEKTFIVSVTNVNEAPVIAPNQSFSITENSSGNAVVGTVVATDPDQAAPFNSRLFSISGGNTGNAFVIDEGTGQIKVNNPAALDFETNPVFSLEVSLTDGGGASAAPQVVTIQLTNLNESPTIGVIETQTIPEDSVSGRITAIVADPETPLGDLIVQATSSNQAVIPNSGLSFVMVGANRELHFVPLSDQSGSSTITLTVSDGINTATRSFVVNVIPVSDAPSIGGLSSRTVNEDTVIGPLNFTVNDPDSPVNGLTITVTSSNTTLIADEAIEIGGTGVNRTLTLTPSANRSGLTVITVTVSDGTLTSMQEFQVTVNPVDDPPQITLASQPLTDGGGFRKPVAIDTSATIKDVDTTTLNFDGAVLRVSGQSAKDLLSILKGGGVLRKGKSVLVNGSVIGTLAGGKKGAPLTVNLNAAATQTGVQELLRHIGFRTHDKIAGNRTIQMQITNIGGGNTATATRSILIG